MSEPLYRIASGHGDLPPGSILRVAGDDVPCVLVPVTIDYEAAAIAMLGLLQNKNVSSRQLVYGTVDAALGEDDE